jgi:hypothetical protein
VGKLPTWALVAVFRQTLKALEYLCNPTARPRRNASPNNFGQHWVRLRTPGCAGHYGVIMSDEAPAVPQESFPDIVSRARRELREAYLTIIDWSSFLWTVENLAGDHGGPEAAAAHAAVQALREDLEAIEGTLIEALMTTLGFLDVREIDGLNLPPADPTNSRNELVRQARVLAKALANRLQSSHIGTRIEAEGVLYTSARIAWTMWHAYERGLSGE